MNRTQHRRTWRGKKFSMRKRPVVSLMDKFFDALISDAIAAMWRGGHW